MLQIASMMFLWMSLWLFRNFQPVEAHNCRSLYIALKANLTRRSWEPWTKESCWEQCFVVREDLALIMNNNQHTQYEWCVPAGRSGMCIVDQGITLDKDEVCGCTVLTRFPRILKDDQMDKRGRPCTIDAITQRLSTPRAGKYSDFIVVWKTTLIPMQREKNRVEMLDYVENGHNVECAVSGGKAHERCGSHGECFKRLSKYKSWIYWIPYVVSAVARNPLYAIIEGIVIFTMPPPWQAGVCEFVEEFNLIFTSPKDLFYRSNTSMEYLQLDEKTDELPIIPYHLNFGV